MYVFVSGRFGCCSHACCSTAPWRATHQDSGCVFTVDTTSCGRTAFHSTCVAIITTQFSQLSSSSSSSPCDMEKRDIPVISFRYNLITSISCIWCHNFPCNSQSTSSGTLETSNTTCALMMQCTRCEYVHVFSPFSAYFCSHTTPAHTTLSSL